MTRDNLKRPMVALRGKDIDRLASFFVAGT